MQTNLNYSFLDIFVDLSIVIGVYNDASGVKMNIPKLHESLKKFKIDFEIVAVNDGSTDDTERNLNDLKKTINTLSVVSYNKNCGKGYAIKTGVDRAKGEYILYTDIDLAYPVEQIPVILEKIKESHADAVIGSRLLPESTYITKPDAFKTLYMRHCVSRIFNFVVSTILKIEIEDTQCGFKCFKGNVLKQFMSRQRINGFCFDVELLNMAKLNKSQVVLVPITVIHAGKSSKVRMLKDSLVMFYDVLRILKYQSQGAYVFDGNI